MRLRLPLSFGFACSTFSAAAFGAAAFALVLRVRTGALAEDAYGTDGARRIIGGESPESPKSPESPGMRGM